MLGRSTVSFTGKLLLCVSRFKLSDNSHANIAIRQFGKEKNIGLGQVRSPERVC